MNRPFSSVIAIFPEGMPSCPPLRLNWGSNPAATFIVGKKADAAKRKIQG